MAAILDPVWYVAYGSNLSWARFECYLQGGTPSGAGHANPGARDPSPPRADVAVTLPGQVYFADHSTSWDGGVAFYDHQVAGATLARAYLLSAEQFTDVMDQEMGRPPGTTSELTDVAVGDSRRLGPGRYETLVACGTRDGIAMLTFTAPWSLADAVLRAPSPAYLATLAVGLTESHGLGVAARTTYLGGLPGA